MTKKTNKQTKWTNKQEVHEDLINYLTVWVQKSLLNWCICEKEKKSYNRLIVWKKTPFNIFSKKSLTDFSTQQYYVSAVM